MSECRFHVRCARWMKTLAGLLPLALLSPPWAVPAQAVDFEVGEVTGRIDTTVSVGASMRIHGRDCQMIHVANGGCTADPTFLNADDGDLNYDKWDVFSNTYKATVDLDLRWRNLGGFFRGTVFYDFATMETNTNRTDLDRDARYRTSPINSGVVGMGYQLLDAYLYGNFEVAGRPLDVRVGNQVLSWGESLFIPGGVNSINTVDLTRLRAPGSQLKEAFLPAPIVRVSTELFPNFGVEAFYQMYWNYTQLDPVGSYFSDNDLVGRAAQGFFLATDPGTNGRSPEAIFDDKLEVPPVVTRIEVPTGQGPIADAFILANRALGADPSTISYVPSFFPLGFPRLEDEFASSQGQWGIALRYFAEAIRTEFGLYYLRIHDKVPSVGFVADPFNLVVETFLLPESYDPGLLALIPPSQLPPNPVDVRTEMQAIPVGYFREYPEDINVFGLSASTEIFGIAWGAELSYKNRQPVPISTAFPEALALAAESGRRARVSGFVRERRLQAQLNAIAIIGPGDPYAGALVRLIRVSSIAVTFEVAAVEFPSLDKDITYAPPSTKTHVDELSWGYQTLVQATYDNPCGIPITLTPRLGFQHDVDGNTPGRFPFIEHRKAFSAGVNVDYLGVWQFDLSYTNWFGAGAANGIHDRDWVTLSATYSF